MSYLENLQQRGIEQSYSAALETIRIEAATHFALADAATATVWATGYLYGVWVGRLEQLEHLDEKVEQLVNFSLALGEKPKDPPFEPKKWTYE